MVRLAEKAFYPGKVPFPLMHIDSKWKFKEMIQFRDEYAKKYGWNLIVESNMEAFNAGVGPFTHGSKVHTDLMKTQALLRALDKYKFDAAFGGARRDEEKSRAKERIFSFRDKFHQWDPKNQRPELWDIYNARVHGHYKYPTIQGAGFSDPTDGTYPGKRKYVLSHVISLHHDGLPQTLHQTYTYPEHEAMPVSSSDQCVLCFHA